jgi:NTE family protein
VVTAFVLTGGGSLGAVQVGMLQALADRGVRPDLLIGTSAGALNAGYVAGRGVGVDALDGLERIWRGLRRSDIFPLRPPRALAALAGAAPSLCPSRPLLRLISRHVTFGDLEDAQIPVHVVATDILSGQEVLLSRGNAADAILASAAIPGIFPSVEINARYLVDGGVADNAAISQAVAQGADRVYVLPTGYACALTSAPRTPLASALQSLTLLVERRLVLEVAHYSAAVDLRVLPPLCPLAVGPADFRYGGQLVERARAATQHWLEVGGDSRPHPERFLSLHRHSAVTDRTGLPDARQAHVQQPEDSRGAPS